MDIMDVIKDVMDNIIDIIEGHIDVMDTKNIMDGMMDVMVDQNSIDCKHIIDYHNNITDNNNHRNDYFMYQTLDKLSEINGNLLDLRQTTQILFDEQMRERKPVIKSERQTTLIEEIHQYVRLIRHNLDKHARNNNDNTGENSKRKTIETMERRETAMNKKLDFMRSVCNELRQELDWSNECRLLAENENKQLATNFVSSNNELNITICELLYKITLNEQILDIVISHSGKQFAAFIDKLTQILAQFVNSLQNQHFDSNKCDTIVILCSIMHNLLSSTNGANYLLSNCAQNSRRFVELVYFIIKHTENQLPLDLINPCLSCIYHICLNTNGFLLVLDLNGLISVLLAKLNAVPNKCVNQDVVFCRTLALKSINLINHNLNKLPNTNQKLKITTEMESLISRSYVDKIIHENSEPIIKEECLRLMLTVITKPEP